jgi:hypothetical protein
MVGDPNKDYRDILQAVIDNKDEWIGGVLWESAGSCCPHEDFIGIITDIAWSEPNFFLVSAEGCDPCGVRLGYCSVNDSNRDVICISGFYGPHFSITKNHALSSKLN